MGVIGAYIFNGKYIIICDNLQQGRDLEPVGNIFETRGGQGSQPFYIISCRKIRFCNINQPKAICIFFGVAGQIAVGYQCIDNSSGGINMKFNFFADLRQR